jgi:RimJ/RimL family protein N-acetyltransferase
MPPPSWRARAVRAIDAGGLAGIIAIAGEIGYWLARDAWGRGHATEAGRAVVDRHFRAGGGDLPSGHFDGNHRAAGVLDKLGSLPAGARRKGCLARGDVASDAGGLGQACACP